jgi:hypothetical protein
LDAFDPTDLRLRIQAGLSSPEMRRLLNNWGATSEEAAAKDASALAHYVVRVGAKQFGPAELIRRLSLEKPLVEWPDVPEAPDSRWAGPMSVPGPTPAPPEVSAALADPIAGPDGDTIVDAPEPPPPSVAAPSSRAPQSMPQSSARGSNALVFQDATSMRAPAVRNGVDVRIVIAIGVGMLAIAGAAFAAGLVWRRPEAPATPAASAPVEEVKEARASGVAGRAATMFEARLLGVAEACGLAVNGDPSREVLELAQEACGRDEVERQRRVRDRAATRSVIDADPSDPIEPLPPDDRPAKPVREPRTIARDPTPPKAVTPSRPSCSTACARVRAECSEACGAEPGDASQYDRYQACTGRCVTQETRCRQSCF